MYRALRPLLFTLEAERAHDLTLRALRWTTGLGLPMPCAGPLEQQPVEALGLKFPNPVGLAAGLDKDGAFIDALARLGFGFIEVGTVTPRPQAGNPQPRLFRLPRQRAILNRMGFNNGGVDNLLRNLERSTWRGILGINIGRNFDTPNERALDDYLAALRAVYPAAGYVTVNISSPNTKGLRELQQADTLREFIATLLRERDRLAVATRRKPLLLKIAPDLDETQMNEMAAVLREVPPDGLICTNTTIDRSAVAGTRWEHEAGGLSGAPLRARADAVLAGMRKRLDGTVPLVGVGGILEGGDAVGKIRAGACLVQLYTGLIWRGPGLVAECARALRTAAEPAA